MITTTAAPTHTFLFFRKSFILNLLIFYIFYNHNQDSLDILYKNVYSAVHNRSHHKYILSYLYLPRLTYQQLCIIIYYVRI